MLPRSLPADFELNPRRCEDCSPRPLDPAPTAARPDLDPAALAPASKPLATGAVRREDSDHSSRAPSNPLDDGTVEEASSVASLRLFTIIGIRSQRGRLPYRASPRSAQCSR